MTASKFLLSTLGELVATGSPGTFPSNERIVRDFVADTLACAVAGTSTRFGQIAIEHARRHGSPATRGAGAVGVAGTLAVGDAAWLNTVLTNSMDYEPVGPEGHVVAAVVPSVLAVAESTGSTSDQILDAVLVGVEVGGRVGAAIRRPSFTGAGNRTPVVHGMSCTIIGAAAAVARLLNLSADKAAHAMAIAAYEAPIPTLRAASNADIAPMTKYDPLGVHSRNAIESAFLADLGATGDLGFLEDEYGFWRVIGSSGIAPEMIIDGLGEVWTALTEVYFKRYPCVLYTSPVLEAISEIRDRHPEPCEIRTIEIRTRDPKPGQRRQTAETEEDAWYSIPINAALTFLRSAPRGTWRRPEVYDAADVQQLAAVIDVDRWSDGFPDPKPGEGPWSGWAPCKVTIEAAEWTEEVRREGLVRLTPDELDGKWRECFGVRLSGVQTDEILGLLERGADAATLVRAASVEQAGR